MTSYVYKRVHNWDDAEDIMITVAMEAWKGRERMENPEDPIGWVWGIVRNQISNHIEYFTQPKRNQTGRVDMEVAVEIASAPATALTDAIHRERLEWLREEMKLLPERNRQSLELWMEMDGQEYGEASLFASSHAWACLKARTIKILQDRLKLHLKPTLAKQFVQPEGEDGIRTGVVNKLSIGDQPQRRLGKRAA